MEAPRFADPAAKQLWNEYFARVKALCRPLRLGPATDIGSEIKAHLLESYIQQGEGSEIERLQAAMARLGEPEDFVPTWVQDRLEAATQPGSGVRDLISLLRLNAARGLRQLLFSLILGGGYLVAFWLFIVAILKPIFPANMGLFRLSDGWIILGYVSGEPKQDLLGYALIPLALGMAVGIQVLLGKLVRRFAKG